MALELSRRFYGDATYYHFPLTYLPNLDDPKYLEKYPGKPDYFVRRAGRMGAGITSRYPVT